jgi:PAS domain S-box-containing protein
MDLLNAPAQSLRNAPNLVLLDGAGEKADPREILADRVKQLYDQLWIAIVSAFAVGGIATFELWEPRFKGLVLFWWGLVMLMTFASTGLLLSYRRSRTKLAEADQWMRWLGLSALAIGSIWGFAGAVFFPAHTDEQQVFLAFLIAGVVTSGVPVFAGSWPVYAVYAGSILMPFAYVLATFGNRLFIELAILVPVFYAVNVAIAYRLSHVFATGYRLRYAYSELTDDYRDLNKRLGNQLRELDEAGRQVEASGRKLALFADRAPIAVLEIDIEARVQQTNPAAEVLFGYAATELTGQPVEVLVAPEARAEFSARWRSLVDTQRPMMAQLIPNVRHDGLDIVCEWTVTPLVSPDGRILSVIAQVRDMSRQLEAERIKKEFTSTLSHELRTPLTSIIGSLELVNSGVLGGLSQDVSDLTVIAERNGQRLLDLINDLLDVEKIRAGKFTLAPAVLQIDDVLEEALVLNRAFAERYKVKLSALGRLPEPQIYADRKRLLQVLTNLLSNAVKFSPEGETVDVALEDRDSKVRVSVHDRGPGVPESFRAKMFTRFSQADSTTARQQGGTGLGLAICKHLIEIMHGRIDFQDRAGGGTTFWFELPKYKPTEIRKEA